MVVFGDRENLEREPQRSGFWKVRENLSVFWFLGIFFFRFEKGKEKKLKKKMGSESKNGGSGGGGGVGLSSETYSPATKKMIQSLKEIVNCPDSEIYAALKECNMDPDDAVNRLLSQGSSPFSFLLFFKLLFFYFLFIGRLGGGGFLVFIFLFYFCWFCVSLTGKRGRR